MPITSCKYQPFIWLVLFLAIVLLNTCMAYQNTNSNTILQQQTNVPLSQSTNNANSPPQQQKLDDTFKIVSGVDPKVAALNIPAVNIVKQQKVPLQYNNATIELVPSSIITQANGAGGGAAVGAVVNTQFLQTPASAFFSNYNSQQNVRQLLRNIDERVKNMRNVEMRVAKIQVRMGNIKKINRPIYI